MYYKQKNNQEESTMSDETRVERRENNVTKKGEKIFTEKAFNEFNKAIISGRIETEFEYNHNVLWEKFYRTRVIVKGLNGKEDYVPIVVSELLIGQQEKMNTSLKGKFVEVSGEFRSYSRWGDDDRKHLDLFIFVRDIKIYEDENEDKISDENLIYLDGYIHKPTLFRITPLGRRITDLIIVVNRPKKRTDCIPCIAWGRDAQMTSEFEVGNRVRLYGRVQSRKYLKRYSPDSDEGEYREAYEISIIRIQKVEE